MDKKVVAGLVLAGLLIISGVGFALTQDKKSDSKDTSTNDMVDHTKHTHSLEACKLFAEADAKAVMGDATQEGGNTPATGSEDIHVTNCTYSLASADIRQIKTATVLVRAPLTDTGKQSNRQVFEQANIPSGSELVSGYGDKAYWTQVTGTLNILKNDNWIIITYGTALPADRTLADNKLIADKVLANIK